MSAENNTAPATTSTAGKTAADKTARASAAVGDSHTGVTRTHSPRSFVATTASAQANREWFVIDATDKPLGRLASTIATVLRGKHKPTFTPHEDAGDFVIVVNADKVRLTGNKLDKKFYYSHSGIPGGFAAESYRHLLARKPTFPVEKAVKGMLPKNVLGRQMLTKLKLYASADHPHVAQKPQPLTVKL